LILGSSRSGAAFDTFYIESLLNFSQEKEKYSVDRFNMTSEDKLSSYYYLKKRIQSSSAPKVLVLQPMMQKQLGDARITNSRVAIRHAGLIPANELLSLKEKFHLDRKNKGVLGTLRIYINRYTALIYGLLKQPFTNVLSSDDCQVPKSRTEKNAWPSAQYTASSDIDDEIEKAKVFLKDDEKAAAVKQKFKKALKKWKGKLFDSDQSGKSFSSYDIDELKLIIELAKKNATKVILVPLPSYNQAFTESDINEFQLLFPQVTVYDAVGNSKGLLKNFWRDPNHISKAGAIKND